MPATILLATNGSPGAVGAVRLAREAAELQGARVEVVAVHEFNPLLTGFDDPLLAAYTAYDVESVDALRRRVESQLEEVGGPAAGWPVTIKRGPVAPMIARAASESGATMIFLGLRHYGRHEHWIGRETPIRVMHLAHVPVLAVQGSARRLPRRAVIATDLGPVSLGAARLTRALVAPGAALHLVDVLPATGEPLGPAGRVVEQTVRERAENELTELALDLAHGSDLHAHTHVLYGDAADAILSLASETAADLISVGSHSYSLFERLLLGSVASRVVRGAGCSVLVAPSAHVSWDLRRNLIEGELLAHLGHTGSASRSAPGHGTRASAG